MIHIFAGFLAIQLFSARTVPRGIPRPGSGGRFTTSFGGSLFLCIISTVTRGGRHWLSPYLVIFLAILGLFGDPGKEFFGELGHF